MIKVVKEVRVNGKTEFFQVENQHGDRRDIRPENLEVFCILREFENAKYCDGRLLPHGRGFDIVNEFTPIEHRRRLLRNFVQSLFETRIHVSAAQMSSREDPQDFQIEAMGFVGKIGIYPGTEYFNKSILNHLHFGNVKLAQCRYIQPSNGYTGQYLGWKMCCPNEVGTLSREYYFRICEDRCYPPHWVKFVKESGICYDKFDIEYYIYVRGDVNGCAVIGKNNEVLEMVLFKQAV